MVVISKAQGILNAIRFASSLPYWERRSYLRYFLWSPLLNLRHFPHIALSPDRYLASLELPVRENSISLDLGCGEHPRNPLTCHNLFGVDLRQELAGGSIKFADLSIDDIPYEDQLFDCVSAFDFLEHIPRVVECANGSTRLSFIELMNEIHRVLAPNGYFVHLTPAYPACLAFRDPTHVNFVTEETFPLYFCGANPWAGMYGFDRRFKLIRQVWIRNAWLLCVMQKR